MLLQLKILFDDFRIFAKNDFDLKSYLYTFLVIASSIAFIYGSKFGELIYNCQIPTSNKIANNIFWFVLFYFLIAVPIIVIRKEYDILKKPAFWLKTLLLVSLIGFTDIFSWSKVLDLSFLSSSEQSFIFTTLWRCRNFMFVLPVLILLRIFVDKDVNGLYGVCRGNQHVKAYLSLYIVILPLLVFISFTPDFKSYYPSFRPWDFQEIFNFQSWLSTSVYETVYMADFFMVELIFRGVMVIGLARLMGRNAVLPMVAIYVMLHFGKPIAETTSAMVGGYFLGALAFRTRHIWGGIIIHMGIALAIELLSFFQYYAMMR